jgi:tRNA threonylcarbamoyladenosine biosynthesis protein TsaB
MKLLAIDTATERCSVALYEDGATIERSVDTPRGHADMILPMIEALLAETHLSLNQLDGIAYGRGPGGFTGVRIAVGVVQGLAFGARLPTIGISNLAAVAQQFASTDDRVLVCMDARMGEVYWGVFECDASGLVHEVAPEEVAGPDRVLSQLTGFAAITVLAGTGFSAYPQLTAALPHAASFPLGLPRAREIALLGVNGLRHGAGRSARDAQPVYLRNQVASVKKA